MYVLNHFRPHLVIGTPVRGKVTDESCFIEVFFDSEGGSPYTVPQDRVDDSERQYTPVEEFLNDIFKGRTVTYRDYVGPLCVNVYGQAVRVMRPEHGAYTVDLIDFVRDVRVPNSDHPYFSRLDA